MASLAILPFTTIDLLGAPRGLPLVARMVLATGILFFAPSALLGMVSPLVVKLTLATSDTPAMWSGASTPGRPSAASRGRC